MNPDGLDIEYICKNEGTVGYIGNEGIIINPDTNQLELVGAAPVYEFPNLQAEVIYELRNDENNITLDVSILSQESISNFRNNITLFSLVMNSTHHINRNAKVTEEDYEEIINNTEVFIPDTINKEFTNSTTKNIINVLMGKTKKEDTKAESLVDDMLADIFGKPVLTKDDPNPITIDPSKSFEAINQELNNNEDLPAYNGEFDDEVEYDTTPQEEEPDRSTFEEVLQGITSQFPNEIVHINKHAPKSEKDDLMGSLVDSMLDVEKDIFSAILEQIVDVCTTQSPEKTVSCEPMLDSMLNDIVAMKFEEIPPNIQTLMMNFCEDFHSNEEIKFNLLDYKDTMKSEKEFLTTLEESKDSKIICVSDMEKYFRIKDSLWSDFNRHHHIYETIYRNSLLNTGLQDSQYPVFFAIAFQLLHLINKNVLKTKHDLYKKEEFMKTTKIPSTAVSHDTQEIMEYETNIIKFGSAFIDDFKKLIQKTF